MLNEINFKSLDKKMIPRSEKTGLLGFRPGPTQAAPVAEWVRLLYFSALNHSIISPLCLV